MGWFPCAAAVLGSPNAQGKPAQLCGGGGAGGTVCVYVVGDAGLLTLGFSHVLSCPMVQELETFSLSALHKLCLQQ